MTNKPKDEQVQRRTDFGMKTVTWHGLSVSLRQQNAIAGIGNFQYDKYMYSYIPCLNTFPHNDTFWWPLETSLLKTLWEKEKLLVTSNFSFSHSIFYQFK